MITKRTIWTIHCPGCVAEYGGNFHSERAARDFATGNPLCPDCDGEDY